MTEEVKDEIAVEPETPEIEVRVEDAAQQEPPKQEGKEITPEEGIQELKSRLEKEQVARAEAEKRAREMQMQAHKAQSDVQDSNMQLILSAMDSLNKHAHSLRQAYSQAMHAGAFDKAAEIQEQMGMNSAKLLQLENGRVALEAQLRNPAPPPVPDDPVEKAASQLSPRSAAWVRSHPQCINDPRLFQKMVGAHNIAVADGYILDSDEYFDFIETQMGMKKPVSRVQDEEIDEPLSAAAAPSQKRSAPPAAPSSRAASSSSNGRNVVRLTAEEREVAQIMGMSPEDYAKNKLALKREGKLN